MKANFSVRLKELRKEEEISQTQLAAYLHIARSTLASWEIDRNRPDFETLSKIADYFDVSVDYLIGRID